MRASKHEYVRVGRVAGLRVFRSVVPDSSGRRPCFLDLGHTRIRCSIGRSGVTRFKREGDGCSPIGRFAVIGWRLRPSDLPGPRPGSAWRLIRPDDGWCDDRESGAYNREIRLPSRAGHERMWRADAKYDVVAILDFNIRPRVLGRGSAIFFHLCSERYETTAGCVAITPRDMRKLIPRIAGSAVIEIG
ncbi:MAG: L,D-transpeptidase family protein [Rhodoblastus sp.]